MRCSSICSSHCLSINKAEITPSKVIAVVSGTLFTLSSLAMLGLLLAHSPIACHLVIFQAATFAGFAAAVIADCCKARPQNSQDALLPVMDEISADCSLHNESDIDRNPEIEKDVYASLFEMFCREGILTKETLPAKSTNIGEAKTEEELAIEFGAASIPENGFQKRGNPPEHLRAAAGENLNKLRFSNGYPYDENIYQIDGVDDFFINASQLPTGDIATQGPLDRTIEDFWRMIWDVQAKFDGKIAIVMLEELDEGPDPKCAKYWPEPKESLSFDEDKMKVKTNDDVEEYEEFTARSFRISRSGDEQEIRQFHIHHWDHLESFNAKTLLTIIRDINSNEGFDIKKVIHCSDGSGSTMAYVACEMLYMMEKHLEGQNETYKLDLIQLIKFLRLPPHGRINAIYNFELYKLIYDFVGLLSLKEQS